MIKLKKIKLQDWRQKMYKQGYKSVVVVSGDFTYPGDCRKRKEPSRGFLMSWNITASNSIRYWPRKFVSPVGGNGSLTLFKNIESARSFVDEYNHHTDFRNNYILEIWKCDYEPSGEKCVYFPGCKRNKKENGFNSYGRYIPPGYDGKSVLKEMENGTVLAKKIRLIKKIESYNDDTAIRYSRVRNRAIQHISM